MLWLDNWALCGEDECREGELIFYLPNRLSAGQWLRRFKPNAPQMSAIRSLLSQEWSNWNLSRLPDDAVIDQVSELLASRRLHIHRLPASKPVGSVGSPPPKADSTPFPIADRKPKASSSPSRQPVDSDAPTFPANLNGAAQASALIAAAQSGAPTCYI